MKILKIRSLGRCPPNSFSGTSWEPLRDPPGDPGGTPRRWLSINFSLLGAPGERQVHFFSAPRASERSSPAIWGRSWREPGLREGSGAKKRQIWAPPDLILAHFWPTFWLQNCLLVPLFSSRGALSFWHSSTNLLKKSDAKTRKRTSEGASKRASKRSNMQANEHARHYTSKRASVQSNRRASKAA